MMLNNIIALMGEAPILDTYNAFGAWSLRRLRSAYIGAAVRIRRSSDNTQTDIGFSGTDFDSASFTTFIGAGNGFVVTWYDQSGNGIDVTNSTPSQQPQIVLSLQNGKAGARFVQASVQSLSSTNALIGTTFSGLLVPSTLFSVYKSDSPTTTFQSPYIINYTVSSNPCSHLWFRSGSSGDYTFLNRVDSGAGTSVNGPIDTTNFNIVTNILNANINGWVNGSSIFTPAARVSATKTVDRIQLGGGAPSSRLNGPILETIQFAGDQSANRIAIEANINAYYALY